MPILKVTFSGPHSIRKDDRRLGQHLQEPICNMQQKTPNLPNEWLKLVKKGSQSPYSRVRTDLPLSKLAHHIVSKVARNILQRWHGTTSDILQSDVRLVHIQELE
jgi:hypothetical protein